jgi:SAM-dependent methyltransferase
MAHVALEDKRLAAAMLQRQWDAKWASESFAPKWANRRIPREVVEAVASGWLPAGGRVLDIGCGLAEIATWFAECNYDATAIDISPRAVQKAKQRQRALRRPITFLALDLCTASLPAERFDILIDRGCLHQIPANLVDDFVGNVCAMAGPNAKLMLFMKAFRDGRPFGDEDEMKTRGEWVRRSFEGKLVLERFAQTSLSGDPAEPLPGMVFWLSKPDSGV